LFNRYRCRNNNDEPIFNINLSILYFVEVLTLITSRWPRSGFSSFNGPLLCCWYQKKALIGFLGASTSFFLLCFLPSLPSFSADFALAKHKKIKGFCHKIKVYMAQSFIKSFSKFITLQKWYIWKFHHLTIIAYWANLVRKLTFRGGLGFLRFLNLSLLNCLGLSLVLLCRGLLGCHFKWWSMLLSTTCNECFYKYKISIIIAYELNDFIHSVMNFPH